MNSNGERHGYAAAVAAATYAINTLEPAGIPYRRIPEPGPQTPPPLVKLRSKAEDTIPAITESARNISKRFTERFLKMKSSSSSSEKDQFDEAVDDRFENPNESPTRNVPEEKTFHPIPSTKKTPTFSYTDQDHYQGNEPKTRTKREIDYPLRTLKSPPKRPPPPPPPPKRPPPPPPFRLPEPPERTTRQKHTGYPTRDKGKQWTEVGGERDTAEGIQRKNREAEAWEMAELARIKDKYDSLNATILEWEDKKKRTAGRKLNKIQERYSGRSDFERKREKAMVNYKEGIDRIKEIADGARAQARNKRIKEESKVKEKAIHYRRTGEPTPTKYCLCF